MTLVSGKEVIETLTKEFEELLTNEHRVWQPVDYGYKWENVEVSIALQIHEESNSQIVKTKGIVNAPLSVVFEFLYDIQTMV